jgi:hypothetical protein
MKTEKNLLNLANKLESKVLSNIERGSFKLISEGMQVKVYDIPEKHAVVKIPSITMESNEPYRRESGLCMVKNKLAPDSYLNTIFLKKFAGLEFAEFQSRCKKIVLEEMTSTYKSGKVKESLEILYKLLKFEELMWGRGLFITDWAGELTNFSYDNNKPRLLDFGSLTTNFNEAVTFVDKETSSKIEDIIFTLSKNGFDRDYINSYGEKAREYYNPKKLSKVWRSFVRR